MTDHLAVLARRFGDELQGTLDAVLPRATGASDASRRVAPRKVRRAVAVEVGYAELGRAQSIPLLSDGEHLADLWVSTS